MLYHIVYNNGNRNQLKVVGVKTEAELSKYQLASHIPFDHKDRATEYGRQLAESNGKVFIDNNNSLLDQ